MAGTASVCNLSGTESGAEKNAVDWVVWSSILLVGLILFVCDIE